MGNQREAVLFAHLDYLKGEYEAGDKASLLQAVEYCGMYKLIMPEWVVYAFTMSHRKWQRLEVKTLDQAFEVEKPKGYRLHAQKELMDNSIDVFLDVNASETIDNYTFERVAKKYDTNRDKVRLMYKDIKENTDMGRNLSKAHKNKRRK